MNDYVSDQKSLFISNCLKFIFWSIIFTYLIFTFNHKETNIIYNPKNIDNNKVETNKEGNNENNKLEIINDNKDKNQKKNNEEKKESKNKEKKENKKEEKKENKKEEKKENKKEEKKENKKEEKKENKKEEIKDNYNYKPETQCYKKGKVFYILDKAINEFNSYLKICLEGTLIDNTKYNLTSNPKITVIMPVYNIGKQLYNSIRSIQNQKMKDIEIILINDASTDDTLNIAEKLKEEDPRIKVINNEKNRRILYSKSIGALYANGKYILELDQDDMFISEKAFDIIYNEAEKNKVDILQFRDFELKQFKFDKNVRDKGFIIGQKTSIETQPNIKNNMFKKYNFLLWGLLIKSDIYKKVVIQFWPNIINYKIIHFEDYSITFLIVVIAKRFEYLNNFYIAHLIHAQSASSDLNFKKELHTSILLFYNFMFEYDVKYNVNDKRIFLNSIYRNKALFSDLRKNIPILFDFVFKKIFPYLQNSEQKNIDNIIKISIIKLWNSFRGFMNENEFKSIKEFQNLINKKINQSTKVNLEPKFSIIIYCNSNKILSLDKVYPDLMVKIYSPFDSNIPI